MEKTVTEDVFWSLVDTLCWREDCDYKRCKRMIMRRFTAEQAAVLDSMFEDMHRKLARSFTEWEEESGQKLDLFDDSFDDFISHLIGFGREEFARALEHPREYAHIARNRSFVESFRYAWPDVNDYRKTDFNEYWPRIKEGLDMLLEMQLGNWPIIIQGMNQAEREESQATFDQSVCLVKIYLEMLSLGLVEGAQTHRKQVKKAMDCIRARAQNVHYGIDNIGHDIVEILPDLKVHTPLPEYAAWSKAQIDRIRDKRLGDIA